LQIKFPELCNKEKPDKKQLRARKLPSVASSFDLSNQYIVLKQLKRLSLFKLRKNPSSSNMKKYSEPKMASD
jgi:hypothetical protein